jgi:hypothetical protein
MSTVNTLPPQ